MTFTVVVESDAERDWHEAVMWYDEREAGVSHRLNVAIRAVLQTLAQQPERFSRASRLTHKAKVPPPWPYSIYFTVNLPFDERVELAHRLWDEFLDGCKDWKTPPMPEGVLAWKTLKAEIDAKMSRADRIKLAQRVWGNIQENGYDPDPTPEQIAELERRAEEALARPERGIPAEQVFAEIEKRLAPRRK